MEFKGYRHVFARLNAGTNLRFVQASRSPVAEPEKLESFEPLVFEGLYDAMASSNIYLFDVVVRNDGEKLVAVFPGVLHGDEGGVWYSESGDGRDWTAPLRLMDAPIEAENRTSIHPVGGFWAQADGTLLLEVDHRINERLDFYEKDSGDWHDDPPAYTCAYRVTGLRDPRHQLRQEQVRDGELIAAEIDGMRAYLAAVYPAQRSYFSDAAVEDLKKRYEQLDFFYSCDTEQMVPLVVCPGGRDWPRIPYIPTGANFVVSGSQPRVDLHPKMDALFGAFGSPVQVLPRRSHQVRSSGLGARMGPQPSWTSPTSIVRYVHFPNGLSLGANRTTSRASSELRASQAGARNGSGAVFFQLDWEQDEALCPGLDSCAMGTWSRFSSGAGGWTSHSSSAFGRISGAVLAWGCACAAPS